MSNANLEKWRPEALALTAPVDRLPVPIHVLTGEAVDVARVWEHHWAAQRDAAGRVVRPGFELAVHGAGRIKRELGAEILELQEALSAAHTDYMLTQAPDLQSPIERAQFVVSELHATLEFLFDDGQDDENDARLDALQETHRDSLSQDAVALALEAYAGLAQMHRDRLSGLGGFDGAMIDEATGLAKSLRERSAGKLVGEPANKQKAALDLRNRIATLLYERMGQVRSAARFVFRGDAEVVRKVTSAWQRRRRAEGRRDTATTAPGEA